MTREEIRWSVFAMIGFALLGWRGADLWKHWDERIPRCEAHLQTAAGERIIDTTGEGHECDEPIGYVGADTMTAGSVASVVVIEVVYGDDQRGRCSFDNLPKFDDYVTASRKRVGSCHDTGRKRSATR